MRKLLLDELLGSEYSEATFHDSRLEVISVDFVANKIRMSFQIQYGLAPDHALLYKAGTLTFENICNYANEPVLYKLDPNATPWLWITADDSIPATDVPMPAFDLQKLPDNAFAHYFYSSTTNSFIFLAATKAYFDWK